jgi:hypothetical protein
MTMIPTFTFNYEIHYKGSVSIHTTDQATATAQFQALQLANLITNAGEPQLNITSVTSDDVATQGGGPTWEPY